MSYTLTFFQGKCSGHFSSFFTDSDIISMLDETDNDSMDMIRSFYQRKFEMLCGAWTNADVAPSFTEYGDIIFFMSH